MTDVAELAADWPADQRAALVDYLDAAARRETIRARYRDVAGLAAAVDPNYRVTPALQLIATAIEKVLTRPRHNLLITIPPQEGKSTLGAVYAPLRALQLNPNCRIILATYADSLAEDHSRMCRTIIQTHGSGVADSMTGSQVEDKLGFRLAHGANKVSAWKIHGALGGMVAVGWGASVTGKRADLLVIDDIFKNPVEADSVGHRRKVGEWFSSVAMTRLSPEASIIMIGSRWHPEDLTGMVIAADRELPPQWRTWRHINIPAISEVGIRDELGREPGVAMQSAREGRDQAAFEATRRAVGERFWYAQYQGSPRIPAGGLFARAWFDPPADQPHNPVATVVGVDPADTGDRDATGIVAASLTQDGHIVFTEDWSGMFTSDQWAHRAVTLALTVGARELAFEAYSTATTYERVIRQAYRAIHADALAKHRASAELTEVEQRALPEQPPFLVHKWRGQVKAERAKAKGDAVGRSAPLRQALETGRARVVDYKMAQLVEDCCGWQVGQHQPDRIAAAVVAHDRLAQLGAGRTAVASPLGYRRDPFAKLTAPYAVPSPFARRLRG